MSEITRYRGDTYPIYVTVQNENSLPIDITDWTLVMSLCDVSAPTVSDYIWQVTASVSEPENGAAFFDFSDKQMDLVGSFYYDIQIVDQANKKRTIKKGTLKFLQDINKD